MRLVQARPIFFAKCAALTYIENLRVVGLCKPSLLRVVRHASILIELGAHGLTRALWFLVRRDGWRVWQNTLNDVFVKAASVVPGHMKLCHLLPHTPPRVPMYS